MKRIVIGEEQEYARRLTDYMIRHLSAEVRVYSFTMPELMMQCEESMDLYILGKSFYEETICLDPKFEQSAVILLTESEEEDCFCRWKSPDLLVTLIEERLKLRGRGREDSRSGAGLIAVYAPSSDIDIKRWIWKELQPGNLYLGLEDIGDIFSHHDMSELCYFIHLHEEDILSELHKMVCVEDGIYYLDSPAWFLDILGLQEEDFLWFYELMRRQKDYPLVYVGLGHTAVTSLDYFKAFDRIILLDLPDQEKIHSFCDRFFYTMTEEGYLTGDKIEIRPVSL